MPRGVVPRQPARTGRQDRVARAVQPAQSAPKKTHGRKDVLDRPGQGKGSVAAKNQRGNGHAEAAGPVGKVKGYNPVAPERVAEILKRLDQLYPDVTCALTHASAASRVTETSGRGVGI